MELGPPFPSLPGHTVRPARLSDGTEVVLKQGPDLDREARMLERCGGMVRLLNAEKNELMLERLGRELTELEDEEATRVAAQVMQKLWTPPIEGFPTLHDWVKGFRHQPRAESIYRELLQEQKDPVLLHGDLHHRNILYSGERGWVAIDPQGVVGEPAYEVGALMRNPLQRVLTMPVKALKRRLDILAEVLNQERQKLKGWSYSQAVLASCWSEQDQDGDREAWLQAAEKLAQA